MSEEVKHGDETGKSASLTRDDKKKKHTERVVRTMIACFMGILMGGLSFVLIGDPSTPLGEPKGILGWLLLLAGIVFQKHIFMLVRIDYTDLGGKDWFYQAFMTFAFWFISWTLLLTALYQ